MRKKTTPRDRKKNTASSCEKTGLIANNKTNRRSVGTESVLDNRSHSYITHVFRGGAARLATAGGESECSGQAVESPSPP
jgi:hypothetical protein